MKFETIKQIFTTRGLSGYSGTFCVHSSLNFEKI